MAKKETTKRELKAFVGNVTAPAEYVCSFTILAVNEDEAEAKLKVKLKSQRAVIEESKSIFGVVAAEKEERKQVTYTIAEYPISLVSCDELSIGDLKEYLTL